MKDYYSILGVKKDATAAEIKKAFRKLAMETHPDKHPGDKAAEERFKDVNEAYSILGDAKKRKEYDMQCEAPIGGNAAWENFNTFFGNDESIFDKFFRDSFGFRRGESPFERHDAAENLTKKFRINISFEEAYTGCRRDVTFTRDVICKECEGTGADKTTKISKCTECEGRGYTQTLTGKRKCPKCLGKGVGHTGTCHKCGGKGTVTTSSTLSVNIPAGAFDGMELRVRGMGNESRSSGNTGDMFLVISTPKFSDDGQFKRLEGADMEMNLQLSLYEMVVDTKVKITLPDGNSFTVKIPPETQPGLKLRIPGKGFKMLSSAKGKTSGDLYIVVGMKIPRKLTPEQLDLLKKFDESLK